VETAPTRGHIRLHFAGASLLGVAGWFGSVTVFSAVFASLHVLSLESPVLPLLLVMAGCTALPPLMLLLRQPRGARVTWDGWGVTEWDGPDPRTAIPWTSIHMVEEGGLQLTDGGTRRIMVAKELPAAAARCRRRAAGPVEALVKAVRAQEPGEASPAPWHQLDPYRSGRLDLVKWIAAILGYPFLTMGLGAIGDEGQVYPIAVSSLCLGSLGLLVRVVRPCRELVGLRRHARRLAGATMVTLEENVGTLLVTKGAKGEELRFDTALLDHPDGRLATRRGPAWVLFDEIVPSSPAGYRGTVAVSSVRQVELATARQARRSRILAVCLEISMRLGLAAVGLVFLLYALGGSGG